MSKALPTHWRRCTEQWRRGVPRNVAMTSALKAHAIYESIGDEPGVSRQRLEQIVSRHGRK
jgi:hypothetical protein